jgi:ATP-dependent HslUV protease ATP-binding subunit HslU
VQAKAELAAEERLLDALVGAHRGGRHALEIPPHAALGELDDKEIEVACRAAGMPIGQFDIPGMPPAAR